MRKKIYFVEDDSSIYGLIEATLQVSEYDFQGFANPLDFLKELSVKKPDLVILDLMLPHMSGYDVLREMSNDLEYKKIPVMILSAKTTELDKVRALDNGATDYITKPFGVLEFLSRIKAIFRREDQIRKNKEIIIIGDLKLHIFNHTFYVGETNVYLTLKEYEIMKLLMQLANTVVDREQFLDLVWGFKTEVETRTLDMHINKLRNKIAQATDKEYIETVRGVGYILKG